MTKLPLLNKEDLSPQYRHLLEPDSLSYSLAEEYIQTRANHPYNVARLLANNPPLHKASTEFVEELWDAINLNSRAREIIIIYCSTN